MLFRSSKESSKAVKNGPGGVLKQGFYVRMSCRAAQKSQKSVKRSGTHIILQGSDQYLEKDKGTQRDLTLKDPHSSDKLFTARIDHESANEVVSVFFMVHEEICFLFVIK